MNRKKGEMRKKERKDFVRAKDAQSEVLGFVIIMGILLSATTLYLNAQIPEWTREYEFEHESNVLQDFSELSATIDMTTLNEDPTSSSALPIGMAPERVQLVGIPATGGTLCFQPEQETFECIASTPDATYIGGAGSWNSTPSKFSYYDSFHVDIFPEGAKLQLEIEEDRIYDSGENESLSGEFQFNNFTVTNGTTLTTCWLALHAINITIGPNSSIIADGGGLFGGNYEEDGKGEGGGHTTTAYSAGGGGAGHNGTGGNGGSSLAGAGGQGGPSYGNANNISTADFGSGGAGGDCGRTISGVGRYVGGKGGDGGGSISLDAPLINLFGYLSANGEDGRSVSNASDSAGGGGGGGSGGTILLKGGNISIYGYLSAQGGNGGRGGTVWDQYSIPENNGGGGGGGSGGRIKIFYGISPLAPGGLVNHINVSGGGGGEDGDGGDGDNTGEQPGSPGDDGSSYNACITYTESIPHYSAGFLVSNVTDIPGQGQIGFDVGSEMVCHGTITWNETTPSGTDIALKVRTSFDAKMSDAIPWEDCPEVTNGQDISDMSSVSDGHRYIQWRAELLTWERSRTPVLHSVNLSYEYSIPTLMNASGNIEFGSKYLYLPNCNLIYEHGAVIKNQSAGEFMLFSPPIAISQGEGGNTALRISSVNLTGNESSVGGSFSSSINAYYQNSVLQTGGLNFNNITLAITTEHLTAWKKWFNETCNEAGLEYGTDAGDYSINENGNTVNVIFYGNESKPVNVWLKKSEVGIENLK